MFGSPRQALGYMYAAQRGPGLARPRWDDTSRGTGRTPWDHVEIATLLYGPRNKGCCGVVRDSAVDKELRTWATTPGYPRSKEIEAVEKRLRRRMREHGLKIDHPFPPMERYPFLDANGAHHDHVVEARSRGVSVWDEKLGLTDVPKPASLPVVSDTCVAGMTQHQRAEPEHG